jgi:outer membrane protein OmpA-like peptidoglycan-associated protein
MKKLSLLFTYVILFFFSVATYAQGDEKESTKPWVITASSHFINFKAPQTNLVSDYLKGQNWQYAWGPTRIAATKSLNNALGIMGTASMANLNLLNGRQSVGYWKLDANIQYTMADGKILPVYSIVEPYFFLGGGAVNIDEKTEATLGFGSGINLWVTPQFGITAFTSYNTSKSYNYWQNALGINFRIGSKGEKVFDKDGDGIVDKLDKCPEIAGPASTNGCPDNDGDGIANADDACPDQAGIAAFKGCPDTDGDGIQDKEDECPSVAGIAAFKGCPDTDGDGIPDKNDGCPTEKGTAANNGCPDTDGDGIIDKNDSCPTEKGSAANKGCPDGDNDGVIDKDDKCPTVPGTVALQGCPEIKQEELKKIALAASSIQFETGKATILKTSYKQLDTVIDIMKKNPTVNFTIDGYTDNVGNANSNKALSQQRAEAVKKYFTDRGVEDSRLDAMGYGAEKPIADNKTPAGRAKNRRVEIKPVQ